MTLFLFLPTPQSPVPPMTSSSDDSLTHHGHHLFAFQCAVFLILVKWNYTADTLFLLYTGCVFIMSFLLLLYVSVILDFICYLVWFGRLFFGSGKAEKCFPSKLIVIASLLHVISAYKRFHSDFLLNAIGGNLYSKTMRRKSGNKYLRKYLNYNLTYSVITNLTYSHSWLFLYDLNPVH